MLTGKKLWDAARDHGWDEVLVKLAPELKPAVEAFEQYSSGPKIKCTCPVHGTSSSSGSGKNFSVHKNFESTGGVICNSCDSFPFGNQVLAWVLQSRDMDEKTIIRRTDIKREYLVQADQMIGEFLETGNFLATDIREKKTSTKVVTEKDTLKDRLKKRKIGESLWKRSEENHPWVERYLQCRGNKHPEISKYMRFSEEVPYEYKFFVETFPGLVFPIVHYKEKDGKLIPNVLGIHRIYLEEKEFQIVKFQPDNLAKYGGEFSSKRMFKWGDIKGACIPLYPLEDSKTLVVCEGPETGIALKNLSGFPVWAGINTWGLEVMDIPSQVEHVIIGADYDVSGAGMISANRLKERVEAMGKKCTIMLPDMFDIIPGSKGVDWDDTLKRDETKAMKVWESLRQKITNEIHQTMSM